MIDTRGSFGERLGVVDRAGSQILELILTLPVLLLVTLGGIQWAMAVIVSQTVQAATAEAARESADLAATATIQDRLDRALIVIQEHLALHGIPLSDTGSGVNRLIVADGDTGETASHGDASLTSSAPNPEPGALTVALVIELNTTPIPNLLTMFGVSWSSSNLEAAASVVK
jgi:hypothetical protein